MIVPLPERWLNPTEPAQLPQGMGMGAIDRKVRKQMLRKGLAPEPAAAAGSQSGGHGAAASSMDSIPDPFFGRVDLLAGKSRGACIQMGCNCFDPGYLQRDQSAAPAA